MDMRMFEIFLMLRIKMIVPNGLSDNSLLFFIQQLAVYYDTGTLVQEMAFLSRFKTWELFLVDDTSACRPLYISGVTSETRATLGFATETLVALPLCHGISLF